MTRFASRLLQLGGYYNGPLIFLFLFWLKTFFLLFYYKGIVEMSTDIPEDCEDREATEVKAQMDDGSKCFEVVVESVGCTSIISPFGLAYCRCSMQGSRLGNFSCFSSPPVDHRGLSPNGTALWAKFTYLPVDLGS